jgi:hypothetical protein
MVAEAVRKFIFGPNQDGTVIGNLNGIGQAADLGQRLCNACFGNGDGPSLSSDWLAGRLVVSLLSTPNSVGMREINPQGSRIQLPRIMTLVTPPREGNLGIHNLDAHQTQINEQNLQPLPLLPTSPPISHQPTLQELQLSTALMHIAQAPAERPAIALQSQPRPVDQCLMQISPCSPDNAHRTTRLASGATGLTCCFMGASTCITTLGGFLCGTIPCLPCVGSVITSTVMMMRGRDFLRDARYREGVIRGEIQFLSDKGGVLVKKSGSQDYHLIGNRALSLALLKISAGADESIKNDYELVLNRAYTNNQEAQVMQGLADSVKYAAYDANSSIADLNATDFNAVKKAIKAQAETIRKMHTTHPHSD